MSKKLDFLTPVCGPRCQCCVIVLLSIFLILYCLWEFNHRGPDPLTWDLLLISGVATFIIAIALVRCIPRKMGKSLVRLADRGTLEFTEEGLDSFKKTLQTRSDIWARRMGLVVATAVLAAFLAVFWGRFSTDKIFLTAAEVIGGYLAGTFLGHMVCYGQLKRLLDKESIQIKVIPGHVDGAGGLKLLGDFYFFQAMVVAIPAIFLAAWWFLIPILSRYESWRDPYLALLILAIAIEVLSFLVPLWSFHKYMQEQKKELIRKADKLCPEMDAIRAKLTGKYPVEEKEALREQVADMTNLYWAIEKMPTWPVDVKTRRRFSLSNLLFLFPFVGNYIGETETWQGVMEVITNFL